MYSEMTPHSGEGAHRHHTLAHSVLSLCHTSKFSTSRQELSRLLPKALCSFFLMEGIDVLLSSGGNQGPACQFPG